MRWHITMGIGLMVLLTALGCAAGPSSKPIRPDSLAGRVRARVIPLVEALYLNSRELKEIYLDLRSVAQAHALSGDNLQLNYVQKATLYIHKAHRSASHQWELLAIMEDIRPPALVDYYTLRHKSLHQALNEAVYDERFIQIYQARITSVHAGRDLDKALAIIEANRNIFSQLMEAIAPLARRDGPADML